MIVFDGDDTLWDTPPIYDRAKAEFRQRLHELGFQTPELIAELDRTDANNVPRLGFSRERFPISMLETYEQLCRRENRHPNQHVRSQLWEIGLSVFEQSPILYRDSVPVLTQLEPIYRLALYTKGDRSVQEQRIDSSGLAHFFTRITIVDDKTPSGYQSIAHDLAAKPDECWALGNSMRSDILPAIESGFSAILIDRSTWLYEHTETSETVPTAPSLTAAIELILDSDQSAVDRTLSQRRA